MSLQTIFKSRISMISAILVLFLALIASDSLPARCVEQRINTTMITHLKASLCSNNTHLKNYPRQTHYLLVHAIVFLLSGLIASGFSLLTNLLFGWPGKRWWNYMIAYTQISIARYTQGSPFLWLGLGRDSPQLYPKELVCKLNFETASVCRLPSNPDVRLVFIALWYIIFVGVLIRLIQFSIRSDDPAKKNNEAKQTGSGQKV